MYFWGHGTLYIKQCKILPGQFVLSFIGEWNKFDSGYTDKCGRFHVLKKGNPHCCDKLPLWYEKN